MEKKKRKLLIAFFTIIIVIFGSLGFWHISENGRMQTKGDQQQNVYLKENFPDMEMYIQQMQSLGEMQKMLEKKLQNIQEEYENMKKDQEKLQKQIEDLQVGF